MSRDAQTYRAARRNAFRQDCRGGAMSLQPTWRYLAQTVSRNDGFRLGWHASMEPSPMGSGVPKPKSAVLTALPEAAE